MKIIELLEKNGEIEIDEGTNMPVICVDVQPEYSGMNDGDESPVFIDIIKFVVGQTGPVLMFVNAEDQGFTGDTVQDIKRYWEDTIRGEVWDDPDDYNESPIDWYRFTIVDKGYGYLRSWMDNGVSPAAIIRVIREMYQQRQNDSKMLFGGESEETYEKGIKNLLGWEFKPWMLRDGITTNWISISQLKRFSGAYIVGGGRNECLREIEILMSAFNIKYKRIDRLIYGD